MNVCGGHQRSITLAGLRSALPDAIELIPGPGCPVCVCPEEDIYQAIQLALGGNLTLAAFGDMLRVPVNVPKGEPRSLDQAHAAGADVRPVASPPRSAGSSAPGPPTAAGVFRCRIRDQHRAGGVPAGPGVPDNLSILLSGRLTWPAVAMLLNSGKPGFDALVAPGHITTVMGPEEWEFVPRQHGIPTAIAGFTPESLLAAFYSVLRQLLDQRPFLDNCYPRWCARR